MESDIFSVMVQNAEARAGERKRGREGERGDNSVYLTLFPNECLCLMPSVSRGLAVRRACVLRGATEAATRTNVNYTCRLCAAASFNPHAYWITHALSSWKISH